MTMDTNDIMESLKMESIWRSNQPIPAILLSAIENGLMERDDLHAALQSILDDAKKAPVPGGYEYLVSGVMAAAEEAVCADNNPDISEATELLRAIVEANENYEDTAPAIEAADKWLEKIDGEEDD